MGTELPCPRGGRLVLDLTWMATRPGEVRRECSCGFVSVGPLAAEAYAAHLRGEV